MVNRLWVDVETKSTVPIRLGNVKYASKAKIIMLQYAIDGGPIVICDMTRLGSPVHAARFQAFKLAARTAREIWAHQAEFDRTILETTKWWKALCIHPTKWRCTAALARMHGLPGALDKLCAIYKMAPEDSKDMDGKKHIDLFCVPNKKTGLFADRHTHPEQWAEFLSYGGQDVKAMRICWRKTPKWNATPRMWAMWALDYRMNHRGVAMDLALAAGAVEATTRAKKLLAARAAHASKINVDGLEETESAVQSATQVKRLLAYINEFGVSLPDLTADTIERRLEDETLPEHIKELLRVRQKASKASTAKYQRVLNQHVHGRLFNLLVFCGAMRTGRWAGRTLQPQNLPRPKHPDWDIIHAIKRFSNGTIDDYAANEIMELASSCLRGLIIAGPGRRLVISDLANIEGRFMAWVAGELWKLEAYAAYDRGEGPDTYKLAYARAFGVDPNDISDDDYRRQIGKVMELALQYYGGVGAFCSMAETYGIRLEELAIAAWPTIPIGVKRAAQRLWSKAIKSRRTYGLEERIWTVCQSLVLMWREAHPMIVGFWEALDTAVHDALRAPGKRFMAGERISVDKKGNWLRIRLPSGRYLNYPATRSKQNGWKVDRSYMGVSPYSRQWARIKTYSGKDAENVSQGGCADIIMDGLLAADDEGYNPVLSVHDEAITEPPDDDRFTAEGLNRLLVESSLWADGLPLAAKGRVSDRYSKAA